MKILFALLFAALTTLAAETTTSLPWLPTLADTGVKTIQLDGRNTVVIRGSTNGTASRVLLLTTTNVSHLGPQYQLIGECKYDGVTGNSFLEMISQFGPGERYFSRTLSPNGDLQRLSGTSGWRKYSLPFDATGAKAPLSRLEMSIVLEGGGTVYLTAPQLLPSSFRAARPGWWSDRTAGLVGGTLGTIIGCLGSLMAYLANKGKARSFVLNAIQIELILGITLLPIGVIALVMRQPFAVWYLLLFPGILFLSILPRQRRSFLKKYEEQELRRITAADAEASINR
jgi:hypothetical protein